MNLQSCWSREWKGFIKKIKEHEQHANPMAAVPSGGTITTVLTFFAISTSWSYSKNPIHDVGIDIN